MRDTLPTPSSSEPLVEQPGSSASPASRESAPAVRRRERGRDIARKLLRLNAEAQAAASLKLRAGTGPTIKAKNFMYLMMLLVGLDPRRVGTSRGPQPPAYMR